MNNDMTPVASQGRLDPKLTGIFMALRLNVCPLGDLPPGTCKTIETGDKVIAIFHHAEGIHAIDDFCPHMGAALSGGHVENGHVHCPWHAWRFRLSDGAWADNSKLKIASYPVVVEDKQIIVEMPHNPDQPTT